MRFLKTLSVLIFATAVSACASRQFYDMTDIGNRFAQTIQSSENIMQKAESDYREKSQLLANLDKAGNSIYRSLKPQLSRQLDLMKAQLKTMASHRHEMDEANADIVSMAYANPKLDSRNSLYGRAQDSIDKFQKATAAFNQDVQNFSNQSNRIADTVTEKKLFYNFDVTAFQKRLGDIISTSQKNQKNMLKVLKEDENLLNNWPQPETRAEQSKVFDQMQKAAQEYTEKAQGLAKISQDMNDAVAGAGQVSTLDNNWPEAQKQIGRLEQTVADLTTINQKFQGSAEVFKDPAKQAQ